MVRNRSVRAGFNRDGVPANMSVERSLRDALARRIALRGPYRRKLRAAEEEIAELESMGLGDSARARELRTEIQRLKARIDAIPFIDSFDLKYHNRVLEPEPSTRAVMFCLMDVSGSMDEDRKNIAKRFFMLLHLFLMRESKKSTWSSSAITCTPRRSRKRSSSARGRLAVPWYRARWS